MKRPIHRALLDRARLDDAQIARARTRIRRFRRMPLVSPRLWMRRALFWSGAVAVSVAAIAFAWAADQCAAVFARLVAWHPLSVLIVSPLALGVSVALTRWAFPGAQGSGIPQVIAALKLSDTRRISRLLSPRIAVGKVLLTLIGLLGGASIGREGPTVQVGATVMHGLGEALRLPRPELRRALVLAGGAAGVSAAFNTPLAGVVFAIEELSHSFEQRTSGTVLTAVVISGACTLLLVGNYTYFGAHVPLADPITAWPGVMACGALGGLLGGLFARLLISAADGLPGRAGAWLSARPVLFAVLCGLAVAGLGLVSGGATYATGYEQAEQLVAGQSGLPWYFFLMKLAATVVSYLSGIPGGIFAPSLAVGAGLGHAISFVLAGSTAETLVLLGMVGYFAGAVQAPITAAVIVMETTGRHGLVVPALATAMLAYVASQLVCRRPLYGSLAKRFLHD